MAPIKKDRPLRIGTRGSPLALAQAEEVRRRLHKQHLESDTPLGVEDIEIVVIRTTGDRITDRPLSEVGGKGLFTKEIETALLDGSIDLAVHSMKDMPTVLPPGLVIDCLLPREDPRDVLLVAPDHPTVAAIDDLAPGAVVGTSSLRRQAQLKHRRRDLQIVGFRGNVGTRLEKLKQGQAHATLLAAAGLNRLNMAHVITCPLATAEMLPAVAQGVIGIERRQDDQAMATWLQPLHDPVSAQAVTAERAFLRVLDGSCRTPIAGYAEMDGDLLWLRGQILRPDGSEAHETTRRGVPEDAARMGEDAGRELRAKGGSAFFSAD